VARLGQHPVSGRRSAEHDHCSVPGTADKGDLAFDQYSQELRLASPKGEFLEYVGGLFYMHGKDDETYQRTLTTTTRTDRGVADYSTTSDSYAAFGEAR
jgi:iron complex outermembrane receptor protein